MVAAAATAGQLSSPPVDVRRFCMLLARPYKRPLFARRTLVRVCVGGWPGNVVGLVDESLAFLCCAFCRPSICFVFYRRKGGVVPARVGSCLGYATITGAVELSCGFGVGDRGG